MDITDSVILSKYEITKIIGTRAMQLSEGAKPLCDYGDLTDAISIAELEYNQGAIPFTIIRVLPDGRKIRIDFKKDD
jgi:DNA-directed RNA polymerase subunit K